MYSRVNSIRKSPEISGLFLIELTLLYIIFVNRMKETTSKEKMLKKIRKALLEKRDNPYPNLEEAPLYEEHSDLLKLQQAASVTEHASADSLEHASVLDAMASLASLRGDDAAAARLYRRVLAIREARLDSGDPLLLRTRERLGGVLARGPQAEAGDGLFAATWPAWQRRYREEERAPLALIEARSRRAEWLLRRGRIAEAEALLGAIPDDQPPLALRARVLRAEAMQQRRNWPAAVAAWRAAIALADEQVPAASAAMARLRVPYAEALAAVGDRDGALAQLQLAAAPLQRELLPDAALIQRLHALQARLASPVGA
jgi:hypothetical protein